jgi:VWFA-related protein
MRNHPFPIYRQAALLLLASMPWPFQTAGQTAPPQSTAKTNVDEVLLDLVVRDKRGKPIANLTPEDIVITDNGVKQTILSFRLVRGSEAVSPTGAATPLDPLRQIRLVTLAFEPLASPDQRKLARTAALDLVKGDQGVNVLYSVVVIDTQLLVLQHFTKDRDALTKAIVRATEGVSAPRLAADSNVIRAQLRILVNGLSTTGTVLNVNELSAVSQLADSGGDGVRPSIETLQARVMLDMLRMGAAVQSNGARLSLSALRALVDGLREMPGRKSIMYFSVGMYLGTELDTPFRHLVAAANRNNVTFYSVDVRGVMVSAQNTAAMTQLNGAAQASNDTTSSNSLGGSQNAVTTAQMTAADTYEAAGRANLDLPIRDLAESTGGFLIGDSNDLRVPLHHVNEEINSYYEVSYNPNIENYNASFRKVGVATSRKDLVIHTRTGYFALPAASVAAGLAPYEMPLLKAISDGKLSNDVHYRASAIMLQPKKEAATVAVLLEVPLGGLEATAGTDTTGVHCTLAALIKDSKGTLVQKISNDRSLRVTAAQRNTGKLLDKTILILPPGKYTLDSAVADMANMKIGAQHAEFQVPGAGTGVGISALIPVRWFTPDVKNLDPEDPFQVGGGSVTPTLDTDFKMVSNSGFRLFFTAYPDASISARPMVEIDFIKDGRVSETAPMELSPPDSRGRIPYLMTVPAEAIRPGDYEIRATVTQGSTSAVANTTIRFEQ